MHDHPGSSVRQVQPSVSYIFPSSQVSPVFTNPSPQIETHVPEEQSKPISVKHKELQPSFGELFPSSQSSQRVITASLQVVVHTSGVSPAQEYPG